MAPATIRAARLSDAGEIAQLTTQLGYDLTEADAADRLSRLLLRDDQQFFYFGCYDLDAAYAHLQANGVAVQEPSTAPHGMRQMYFADPDGFNLCFQHPVSEDTVEQWRQWYGTEPR